MNADGQVRGSGNDEKRPDLSVSLLFGACLSVDRQYAGVVPSPDLEQAYGSLEDIHVQDVKGLVRISSTLRGSLTLLSPQSGFIEFDVIGANSSPPAAASTIVLELERSVEVRAIRPAPPC